MRYLFFYYRVLLCILPIFLSCSRNSHGGVNEVRVDSLYANMATMRYSDITVWDSLATELSAISNGNNEQKMVATNAMAYSAMMRMDYGRAVELYRYVNDNSDCEIESLIADVGLMTLCYRVSANRSFFDYRTSAISKIKRISEEYDYLTDSDRERFDRAKVEMCIVSICYFSNFAMQNEVAKVVERLENNMENVTDVPLRLYARMILTNNISDIKKRLSQLSVGLSIAENNDMLWLAANYRLLLAIALRENNALQLFAKDFSDRIALLLPHGMPLEELPSLLAGRAVEDFSCYGDEYMMIEAMAVKASCCTRLGKFNESLEQLSQAYLRIGDYYSRNNPDILLNEPDSLLYCLEESNLVFTDLEAGVYNIPECLLSVCREASCAYAGLGDKILSDINREAYLELLRTTRLNKHLESRISTIEEKVSGLRVTSIFILILFVALLLYLLLVHRRRMIREKSFSMQRKKLLKVCRIMFSSLPHDIDNKQQLFDAISALLNEYMGDFAGKTCFYISETMYEVKLPYKNSYPIPYTGSSDNDKLTVASELPLDAERNSLIAMLMPYVAVAIEEGMRLYDIGEEREKLEEVKRASAIYLAEHKRENILKRVSVSIVSNMRTFMDRISNELKNLTGDVSEEDAKRKLQYVSELAEKLGDLNHILERWIKTRQGEVNLRIENFSISDLFAIVEKNNKQFESRGLVLMVRPSDGIVKADRALTLFMINTLLDNAAKFTSPGGSVLLECIEGNGFMEIAVTDTGIGLSEKDMNRIVEAKVYDASHIGEDNELLKPKSKGGGFGLMNCKGIIEKYKKTDSLFSVCSFDVSSTKGMGSRFSFRLPKGLARCMLLLVSLFPVHLYANGNSLKQLEEYADSVFMCNVNGNHADAFVVAQDALDLLNSYYRENVGGNDTLSLHSGKAAELSWWRNSLFNDSVKEEIYYNILDIRNEVAVASLVLNNWDSYSYNNKIYSTLYRLIHEDSEIADRYAYIQQVANRYEVAIAFSCFLLLMLLIYYVITFVRHNIIEKTNERLVIDMNDRLLNVAMRSGRRSVNELAQDIVDELYACMGETMRMKEVAMLLSTDERHGQVFVVSPSATPRIRTDMYMQYASHSGESVALQSDTLRVIPLYAMNGGEHISVGVLEVATERPLSENEIVSLELVASYMASVAYHSAMRVASGYMALEELEEETERLHYEENRLHVQNMVMDNCLSVIKHETVYYPSRIKGLSEQALLSGGDNKSIVADMRELMEYYSSVFGILSNCAVRELDSTCFRLKKIELSQLFDNARRNAERMLRKSEVKIDVICEETDALVNVDTDIVDYLFAQLFSAALKIRKNGQIVLRAIETDEFVTVEFADNRYEITNAEVAGMFTAAKHNVDDTGGVNAMEYLVAKEIVRLHEDFTGKHGGRMEARSDVSGTVILFTLPK